MLAVDVSDGEDADSDQVAITVIGDVVPPVVSPPSVSPDPVAAAPLVVTANADDSATGGSNIVSAEAS